MHPITLLIKPASGSCNMNCRYCFYYDEMNNREVENYGMMDEKTMKSLIRKAMNFAEGQVTFTFQGGEPTLIGMAYYQRFVAFAKKSNLKGLKVHYAIQTNGLSIDEEWAKFFKEYRFLVGLSLDGPEEIHDAFRRDRQGEGTYKRVIESAALLESEGVDFNILTVVNRNVARSPKSVYEFFKEQGFKYLQFIPCLDSMDSREIKANALSDEEYSLSAEDYGDFLVTIFDLWKKDLDNGNPISIRMFDNLSDILNGYPPESCDMRGVCSINLVVEADGSIFPCDFYATDKWLIGNIKSTTISEVFKSSVGRDFVQMSRHVDQACRECDYWKICRGGCRRHRESAKEGQLDLNRFCIAYKQLYGHIFNR